MEENVLLILKNDGIDKVFHSFSSQISCADSSTHPKLRAESGTESTTVDKIIPLVRPLCSHCDFSLFSILSSHHSNSQIRKGGRVLIVPDDTLLFEMK